MPYSTYPHVRVAHIDRVACPLHILELKKHLNEIAPSETLKVIPGNPAVASELIAACNSLGHKTRMIDNNESMELYVTRQR